MAFFTFSTHSLQLPFSRHNSGHTSDKGAVTQHLDPRSSAKADEMYVHTERTRYAHAVWSMLHVNWLLCKSSRC